MSEINDSEMPGDISSRHCCIHAGFQVPFIILRALILDIFFYSISIFYGIDKTNFETFYCLNQNIPCLHDHYDKKLKPAYSPFFPTMFSILSLNLRSSRPIHTCHLQRTILYLIQYNFVLTGRQFCPFRQTILSF